ncbi:MAG: hypothetical protein PHR35_04160 [Kiritimatiellae bacterium]|nr:hypothetical protein [Kiritimatiellia bacterium]
MTAEMQLDDLAILLGLPRKGPSWISEHVNRIRQRPVIERRLAAFFHLTTGQLRSALWPSLYPSRARARARLPIKESK